MKLPEHFFIQNPGDHPARAGHTLRELADWVVANKPTKIEMTETQFWNFTLLQPLPYEERYWTTFHGIPIRCPEMTVDQQMRLRIWNYYPTEEEKNELLAEEAEVYDNPAGS